MSGLLSGEHKKQRSGRTSGSRGDVLHSQRQRLLVAAAEAAAARGCEGAVGREIVSRAEVSARSLYELFDGSEAVLLAAAAEIVDEVEALLRDACQGGGAEWPDRVRAALEELFAAAARKPGLFVFLLRAGHGLGPAFGVHYQDCLARSAALLSAAAGRDASSAGADVHVEAAVGAVAALLGEALAGAGTEPSDGVGTEPPAGAGVEALGDAAAEPLERLLPRAWELLLVPYLGAAEARRIVSGR